MTTKISPSSDGTRSKIGGLSRSAEEVLLLLLTDIENLREELDAERGERQKEASELRDRLEKETLALKDALNNEIHARVSDRKDLQAQLDKLAKESKDERDELQKQLDKEREERTNQAKEMDDYFRTENENRKANLDEVNKWIRDENEKRMAEAEALRAKLEKEKQELRDFLEQDSKNTRDKLKAEGDERARKEREMADKMKEQAAASENEVLQLHKRMAAENNKRIEEIDDLRNQLNADKEALRIKMEKENAEIVDRLQRENEILREQLDGCKNGLQKNIDGNHNDNNKRINDLVAKLASLLKDSHDGLDALNRRLLMECDGLKSLMAKPLSVYFNAYRTEDYDEGGEAYLTFQGMHCNLGGGMDAKSGVFTAPIAGSYLFTIHACTHDMHKALLSIRHNSNQVATFFDQNHESNHKNSMVGQSVILEVEVGDRVQVYIFTATGLHDKPNNYQTQFVGVLLRPKDFLKDLPEQTTPIALTNGDVK